MVVGLFESVDIKQKGGRFAITDKTTASVLYRLRAGCKRRGPANEFNIQINRKYIRSSLAKAANNPRAYSWTKKCQQ
jgi:hypothetical protein